MVTTIFLGAALIFKRMSERIADEQSRALIERSAALAARFQALQARTNPHFLFNTLNSVLSLIRTNPGQAEDVVARLAALLRYSLERSEQPHVSLREEVGAVRDYLAIEAVRFGDRLRVELDIGGGVDLEMRVPPMVLQPLVENAVLHGVRRCVEGGLVRVTAIGRADGSLDITVDDDGPGASPHVGTGTSLLNLEERLVIAYGARAALVAGRHPAGGFRARLSLPAWGPAWTS